MVAAIPGRVQSELSGPDHRHTDLLIQSIQAGDVAAVESVLAGNVDVNASTPAGTTPLMSAAEYGQLEIVRSLLRRGAAIDATRCDGFTALALAVFFGYGDVVRELLARGADANAQSRNGTSLEMWAIARGFVELADFLKAAGQQSANASTPMTSISEPTPSPAPIQPDVVVRKDEDLYETTFTETTLTETRLVGPRANPITNFSEDRDSPVVEGPKQPRPIELDELAAEIKAERPVDTAVPFSAFGSLQDRLGTSWSQATALLAIVAILSAILVFTVLRSSKRAPQESPSQVDVARSSSTKPVQSPALETQPIPLSVEQTASSANVPNERPPEDVSSQSSNHVTASSPNAMPPAVPPAANNSDAKPRVIKTVPSPSSEQRKGQRAKRKQDEAVIATDNRNPLAEANSLVPVTSVPKPQPTQARSATTTGNVPSSSTEPIKSSSTKRKVIQWP